MEKNKIIFKKAISERAVRRTTVLWLIWATVK